MDRPHETGEKGREGREERRQGGFPDFRPTCTPKPVNPQTPRIRAFAWESGTFFSTGPARALRGGRGPRISREASGGRGAVAVGPGGGGQTPRRRHVSREASRVEGATAGRSGGARTFHVKRSAWIEPARLRERARHPGGSATTRFT